MKCCHYTLVHRMNVQTSFWHWRDVDFLEVKRAIAILGHLREGPAVAEPCEPVLLLQWHVIVVFPSNVLERLDGMNTGACK